MATARDVFSKALPNVKLATRFDADGKEIQVHMMIHLLYQTKKIFMETISFLFSAFRSSVAKMKSRL